MEYRELVGVYQRLEDTSSTNQKTAILAEAFEDMEELLPVVVKLVRGAVFATWEREELGVSSSLTKEAIRKATGIDAEQLEAWWREEGDLGAAAERAVRERKQTTLVSQSLDIITVHDTIQGLAEYAGPGSQQQRIDRIAELLTNASPAEARYIVRTVAGAMRLGVGEGTVRDAIATAFLDGTDDSDIVERAFQVTNDYPLVARTARADGRAGLERLGITVFRPLKVMLAEKADGIPDGLQEVAPEPDSVLTEIKYDGIRTQIHVDDGSAEVYTRRLERVTEQFPEIAAEMVDAFGASSYIVEGEIVGYEPDSGAPVPFQRLSRRVKRKYDIDQLRSEIPVRVHLFDLLFLEGDSLLEAPLEHRIETLEAGLSPEGTVFERAANCRSADPERVHSFYERALDAGHEGIMLKNLDAAYQPGTRVGYMMKVKPTMEPLELVVPRAKWSEGRRANRLGRIYLACRDPESGAYLEVGRMATGFTDEELEEMTDRLEPLIEAEQGREVRVTPEVVVEVEAEAVQSSPEYESGFALRFPRFEGFRDDIAPDAVDSLDRIRELYDQQ